jgi:lysophospholipase L1-like esterase
VDVVKKLLVFASVAAGFFLCGLIVGHYRLPPYDGIKALKQRLNLEIPLAGWSDRKLQGPVDVVMLGDSITAQGEWNDIFPQVTILNLGIAGDTSAGVLNRLEDVVNLKPRTVFLMIGINDLLRDFPVRLIEKHVELSTQRLLENGITPIIQSTLHVSNEKLDSVFPQVTKKELNADVKVLNALLRDWCFEKSIVYIDLNDVFSPGDVLLPAFSEDGIHLNKEAYRVWGDIIWRYVISSRHVLQ